MSEIENFIVEHLWHAGTLFDQSPEFLAEAAKIYQGNRQHFNDLSCIERNGMAYFLEGERGQQINNPAPSQKIKNAVFKKKARGQQKKKKIRHSLAQAVFRRDQFTCQICQKPGGDLTCDHILAESKGGETTLSNLRTACRACNIKRGNRE